VTARRKKASGSGFERLGRFVRDYTEGMEREDLRRLVNREAPQVYTVLMRDQPDLRPAEKGPKRLLHDARLLFLSLSAKLSPRRRLLFAIALIFTALGLFDLNLAFNSPDHGFRIDASPLAFLVAIGSLLFLLAAELVDRVLVRDELEVARQLQSELLPKSPPTVPGWSFASSWSTANDIGGDYHRFEPLADGRMALVVADASGHGMAAGLLMAITDTGLRIALDLDSEPSAVAEVLDRALRRTGDGRSFVTFFYGRLDPASGHLEFVSAGHPSPLVRRRSGEIEEPASGSLPLGVSERCEPYRGELTLSEGDLLVITTDGLFEALDPEGETFGWERLRALVGADTGGAEDLHARLRTALKGHAADAPASDDCTIVVAERQAPAVAES
jgi:hypothetical protein